MIRFLLYRKAHSDISMTWLKHIAKSGAPTLLCLTFGDQLYAENMGGLDKFPEKKEIKQIVKRFQMVCYFDGDTLFANLLQYASNSKKV